ncbi:MAG: hypothetical protein NEA02_12130, partial [Thermoanaerobaculia bacterium]|nr:hypothetical protein [Thermoanaerobaculia bacterium]
MRLLTAALLVLELTTALHAGTPGGSPAPEAVDTAAISRIIDEGMNRSRVMETMLGLTDVNGPRLTWSPGFDRAALWVIERMNAWGLSNARVERWAPLGVGWTLKKFSASVLEPYAFPLHAYPRAWSNGTNGTVRADVVHLDAATDSALQLYRGTLKGRVVLVGDSVGFDSPFEPMAVRETDSSLLALANAGPERRRRPWDLPGGNMQRRIMAMRKLEFCQSEKAAAILLPSRSGPGIITVQAATVPDDPEIPYNRRAQSHDRIRKELIPQIAVAPEHYNRMLRLLRAGRKVTIELALS